MTSQIPPPPAGGRAGEGGYRRPAEQARDLRRNATVAERVLWKRLRGKHLDGLRFRRQHPIGRFIADFCCRPSALVIEIDGYFHDDPERVERDRVRTAWLEKQGYRVLRFRDREVLNDLERVVGVILEAAGRTPFPALPLAGGGG